MSIFDKLKFWKHEEPDLFAPIGGGPSSLEPLYPSGDRFPGDHFEERSTTVPGLKPDMGSYPSHGQNYPSSSNIVTPIIQPQPYSPVTQSPKEFEMVNSKLDGIKSMLENINLRLEKIERPMLEQTREREFAKKKDEWRY